ncbi:unnamed protein product [Acanthoscelides obtectus]|uniref:DUF4371 domain-containing protein n=1 Tax=Acanthoscelides obtectus TaxID=200917 RepID=A0A9P0KIE1_ACAOB|nr:unnamed protein product [Acanthoscelides obtectus]CAK1671717.1 hypothetical protein AOBTE_LOCUS28415 [Acanthoscelides obtectus]
MSIDTFDFIVERLLNSIKHQNTPMRACIPPKEMVAVTIRFCGAFELALRGHDEKENSENRGIFKELFAIY